MIGRLVLSDRNIYKIKSDNKHISARKCFILSDIHNDILIKTSKDFNPKDEYIKINNESNTILDGLGNVGDEQSDIDIYYHLHTLGWMSKSKYNKLWDKIDMSFDLINYMSEKLLNNESEFITRIDYSNEVITIDPFGSIDLDDGFSFFLDDNYYYLDIHIADPMSLFDPNNPAWIEILNELGTRLHTCYIGTNPTHLLPEKIVKQVSLLEDKSLFNTRRAISFCFKISKFSNDIKFNLKFSNLFNIKNYTYEDYDNKINLDINLKHNLVNLSNKLIQIVNMNIEPIIIDTNVDISHKMIEIFMILTNWYGGNYLVNNNWKNTIIRVQEPTNLWNHKDNSDIFNITNVPIYARPMLSHSANYIWNNNSKIIKESDKIIESDKKNFHYSLGIYNYAHMSSPMRRFIDMINHLGLYQFNLDNYLDNQNIINNIRNINKINNIIKNHKKISNAYDLITWIKNSSIYDKNCVGNNNNCNYNKKNKFKACLFDWEIKTKQENLNKINCLLVLNQPENKFTKIVNVELPQIELTKELKKYMEFDVELYYNSNNFKSCKFPFSIKII